MASTQRTGALRTLIGLTAAGLLAGAAVTVVLGTAADWLAPGTAEAAGEKAEPAKPKAKPAAAKVSDAAAPRTRAAVGPQSLTQVQDQVAYQYNALGRRDPFQSLVSGEFVGEDVGGNAPPDVGGLTVVGVVWGADDKFAMVEDARGNSMVLRRGDKVMNGVVEQLKRDAVVVKLTVDGQTDMVTVPLTKKGDRNANR